MILVFPPRVWSLFRCSPAWPVFWEYLSQRCLLAWAGPPYSDRLWRDPWSCQPFSLLIHGSYSQPPSLVSPRTWSLRDSNRRPTNMKMSYRVAKRQKRRREVPKFELMGEISHFRVSQIGLQKLITYGKFPRCAKCSQEGILAPMNERKDFKEVDDAHRQRYSLFDSCWKNRYMCQVFKRRNPWHLAIQFNMWSSLSRRTTPLTTTLGNSRTVREIHRSPPARIHQTYRHCTTTRPRYSSLHTQFIINT